MMSDPNRKSPGNFAGIPDVFWQLSVWAGHRLLMLDYDGTLVPFQLQRQNARLDPGLLEILARIAVGEKTTVAIVSGRPLSELEKFVPLAGIHLVGEHGFEERSADGERITVVIPPWSEEVLQRAAAEAEAAGLGSSIERKRTAVVLHTRGLAPEAAARAKAQFQKAWQCVRADGHRIDPIQGGIELRASGRNKGTAVRDLIGRAPAGTFPVYIGDDDTDEDAFAVIRACGFGIKVGPPPTLARSSLDGCQDVADFLRHWLVRVESSSFEKGKE